MCRYAWVLPAEVETAPYGGFAYEFTPELKASIGGVSRLYPIVNTNL